MNARSCTFRWLQRWIGGAACWVLAAAHVAAQIPAPATSDEGAPAATVATSAPPAERGQMLYPSGGAKPTAQAAARGSGEMPSLPGLATSFVMLLALCGAGFYLLRRQNGFAAVSKGARKLVVSESRSLGNRQFLVVVEYERERILVGVTPGKIDYLCPLPMGAVASDGRLKV